MGSIKEAIFGMEPRYAGSPEIQPVLVDGASREGVLNLLERGVARACMRVATTDEERLAWAERLVTLGDTEDRAMEKVIRSMKQQEAAS